MHALCFGEYARRNSAGVYGTICSWQICYHFDQLLLAAPAVLCKAFSVDFEVAAVQSVVHSSCTGKIMAAKGLLKLFKQRLCLCPHRCHQQARYRLNSTHCKSSETTRAGSKGEVWRAPLTLRLDSSMGYLVATYRASATPTGPWRLCAARRWKPV